MRADEGYVDFRGHRTWYRVVGDLEAARAPLVALHGGPGSTHHYVFTLFALNVDKLQVPEDASAAMIGFMINAAKIGEAKLTAVYSR